MNEYTNFVCKSIVVNIKVSDPYQPNKKNPYKEFNQENLLVFTISN